MRAENVENFVLRKNVCNEMKKRILWETEREKSKSERLKCRTRYLRAVLVNMRKNVKKREGHRTWTLRAKHRTLM